MPDLEKPCIIVIGTNDVSLFSNTPFSLSLSLHLLASSLPPPFSLTECGAARLFHCRAQRSAGRAAAERCIQEAWLSGPRVRHTLNTLGARTEVHINLRPISAFMSTGVQMNSSVRRILLDVLIKAGNTGWCSLRPSEDG